MVTCPFCGRDVPDTLFCVACGKRLRGDPIAPRLTSKEQKILSVIASADKMRVSKICTEVGGSKGSVRTILTNLVRYGLVDKPHRGVYAISARGREVVHRFEEVG